MPRFMVLTLLLALVGCGTAPSSAENFQGEQAAVAQAIEDLAAAGRAGDAEEICSTLLTRALAERIKAGSATCASELGESLDDVDDFELEVRSVTVSGTTATARVEGNDGTGERVSTLRLVKERGEWRVSALS